MRNLFRPLNGCTGSIDGSREGSCTVRAPTLSDRFMRALPQVVGRRLVAPPRKAGKLCNGEMGTRMKGVSGSVVAGPRQSLARPGGAPSKQ